MAVDFAAILDIAKRGQFCDVNGKYHLELSS